MLKIVLKILLKIVPLHQRISYFYLNNYHLYIRWFWEYMGCRIHNVTILFLKNHAAIITLFLKPLYLNIIAMNKKLFLIIFICGFTIHTKAQSSAIDSVAVSILDNMSAMIGDLTQCSVTVNANYDVHNQELGLVKRSNE